MERHVNAGERDSSEAPLEDDIALALLLLASRVDTVVDDLLKHFLDFLDSELLGKLHSNELDVLYKLEGLPGRHTF